MKTSIIDDKLKLLFGFLLRYSIHGEPASLQGPPGSLVSVPLLQQEQQAAITALNHAMSCRNVQTSPAAQAEGAVILLLKPRTCYPI